VRGALLLVEEEAVHTIRISLQGDRAVFQMRQKHRRDANVVVDDLPFRKTRRRIQHLIEVRDHDLFTCDFDLNFFAHVACSLEDRLAVQR
jgi:hypothetical protein